MSSVRFISTRSPYRRGSLEFGAQCAKSSKGFAMVELNKREMERLGETNYRELLMDPAITVELVGSGRTIKRAKPKSEA